MENQKSQKKVWENIAEEWHEFRQKPAQHTLKFLKDKKGKILDLGSGSGRHLIPLKKAKFYLVDFSEKMIQLAKQKANKKNINAEFFVSDLSSLPFEDNFFDYAIAISSIHCLETHEQRKKSIKEIFRVLKPGAEAEIALWNKASKRFKNSKKSKMIKWRDKGERFYYLFEPEEAYSLFKKTGFEITYKEDPARMIVFIIKKPN